MQSPCVSGEELRGGFETSVGIPELGRQDKATKGFGAAGVEGGWRLGWAGEEGRLEDAGVVEGRSLGVEGCIGGGEKASEGEEMAGHGAGLSPIGCRCEQAQ